MAGVVGMLRETLGFMLYALVIIIPLSLWMLKNKQSKAKIIVYALFVGYLFGMIAQICLPINYSSKSLWDNIKDYLYREAIYLIPFKQQYFDLHRTDAVLRLVKSYLLNIMLTIPFGIFLAFFKKLRMRSMLAIALLVGLGAEIIQLVTGLIVGYQFRITHIDDLVMNAIGVMVGYVLINSVIRNAYLRVLHTDHTPSRRPIIDDERS
ncbi:VanZ family protein [Herpetosiphon llansteffanensis]|uniref:VanZ family protein n=1 Tax=Herpetosiphon llansteffanensis TaxID=2094568 RepID=UPI000D7BE178|nr:VanZ family protein [Herpetosiphon llansteffanensis]